MGTAQQPFEQRIRRIERKHSRMDESGSRARLKKDGLIELRPRRRFFRLRARYVVYLLAAAFLFKVAIYLHLGAEDYAARLATLDQAQMVDRIGAAIMAPDPATLWIAEQYDTWILPYIG